MRYLILLASLAFVACGDSSDDSSAEEVIEEASKSLNESMHEPIDAAEEVEDELMKAKQGIDDAMREAEGARNK